MHDIEAMLEGFALTCLAQGVLDSRFRGNDNRGAVRLRRTGSLRVSLSFFFRYPEEWGLGG